MQAIRHCTACHYIQLLFKTLFLITYCTCLRAGEIVVFNYPSHVIQMRQPCSDTQDVRFMRLTLPASSICSKSRSPTLTLLPISTREFCPVTATGLWLAVCVRTRAIDRDLIEIGRDLIEIGRDIISNNLSTEIWSRSSWNTSRCNNSQWHPAKLVAILSNMSWCISGQSYPKKLVAV